MNDENFVLCNWIVTYKTILNTQSYTHISHFCVHSFWFSMKDCFIACLFYSVFLGDGIFEALASHLQCYNTNHNNDDHLYRRLYPRRHCSTRSKYNYRWVDGDRKWYVYLTKYHKPAWIPYIAIFKDKIKN